MPRAPLNIPFGLITDDTTFAAQGAWGNADKVRFWRGRPQTIGGWESFISTQVTGIISGAAAGGSSFFGGGGASGFFGSISWEEVPV